MAVFARATILRAMLAGLLTLWVHAPLHPANCFAESEASVSDDETFTLPENGVRWTRDGNPAEMELTWAEAHGFLNDLNQKKFGGCEGWRMPSREELAEMLAYLDAGNTDEVDIPPVQDDYWSSSSDPLENGYADVVNMGDGSVDNCQKSEINFVWPVCGQ